MSSSNDSLVNADSGQRAPLRGVRLAAAGIALLLWAAFTGFMIAQTNTGNEIEWTRLAYLFASVEAIAFGAAGALWGTTINRQRAEQAEKRAAANERDASSGRALASSQIAEAGDIVDQTSDSALQSLGGGPDRATAEVLQRHARQARMLFPDL
jgi:hypothetical protein